MKLVNTENAAAAIGPYSQAVRIGSFLFSSGQLGIAPNGALAEGGIEAQTKQVLEHMKTILASQGLSLSNVIKTTIFVQDLSGFAVLNEIYRAAFGGHKPARSTVQVAALPLGGLVEIEFIAAFE